MRENQNLKLYTLSDIKQVKVHGRTTGCLNPLTLFWTGSALELNVTGSELWLEIEADYEDFEPWISIVIDGVTVSRLMVTAGRRWICIFRTMNEGVVKNVRIVKEVQAMSCDPDSFLKLHAVKSDGIFQPVAERPYKIEFIGDSITSGEGAVGAQKEEDWISMWFSAIDNYTAMTAAAVNAEYRIISQSGWGVYTSWDNNPHNNIPEYYDKVCGILTGETNRSLGSQNAYDFASWQPDVVVINLGTNDGSAFISPEWRDETTGETHKQRTNEDGSFYEKDLGAFKNAAENFLMKIRAYNPNAHIIWGYGMLGELMLPVIRDVVAAYAGKTGDTKVTVLKLPETTTETAGARCHPGRLSHAATAAALSDYILKILQ